MQLKESDLKNIGDFVSNQVNLGVWPNLKKQSSIQVRKQVDDQIWIKVRHKIYNQVRNQIYEIKNK